MKKTILVLGLILTLVAGVMCIFLSVLLEKSALKAFNVTGLYVSVLSALGGTMITAVLVALTIEWYSLRNIEDLFARWNKRAGTSALSAVLGGDIPDSVADGLVGMLGSFEYIRRDFSMTYRFYKRNHGMICKISTRYSLENLTNRKITVPCKVSFLKGFLPDRGGSLRCLHIRLYEDSGRQTFEHTKPSPVEENEVLSFPVEAHIDKKSAVTIDSQAEFAIPTTSYHTFITFSAPVHGFKLSLETDIDNAHIGIQGNAFWSKKLLDVSKTEKSYSMNFRGVAFGGQAIGLWIYT